MRFVAYLEQKEIENYILQIIKYREIIIFFYITSKLNYQVSHIS